MKRLRSFKLYPDHHFVYFEVFVHGTIQALRKSYGAYGKRILGYHRPSLVIFFPPKGKGKARFTGCIGEIHFCQKWFRVGIMSHEVCHATFEYFRLRKECRIGHGYRGNTSPGCVEEKEEAFCWVNGNLNRQLCFIWSDGEKAQKFIQQKEKQGAIKPIRQSELPKHYL